MYSVERRLILFLHFSLLFYFPSIFFLLTINCTTLSFFFNYHVFIRSLRTCILMVILLKCFNYNRIVIGTSSVLSALGHVFEWVVSLGSDHDPSTQLPVVGLDLDPYLMSMDEPFITWQAQHKSKCVVRGKCLTIFGRLQRPNFVGIMAVGADSIRDQLDGGERNQTVH